jgi:GT2 family glycosyltransferase
MRVSVVILTWNSARWLPDCLASVVPQVLSLGGELIIVDNGSTDASLELVRKLAPSAILIANRRNRGVAPARNQGIRASRGFYIVLLDVDTRVPAGTLAHLTTYMDTNPSIGILGPKLVYPDGTLQYSCRRYPTLGTKLLRRLPRGAGERFLWYEQYRDWDHSSPRDVDYVIGACQVIRRQVLDQTGLLDEAMFYGPEDVDLCLRARLCGWRVVYYPYAQVVHCEERVTRRQPLSRLNYLHARALIRYFAKHRYLFSRKTIYRRIWDSQPKGGMADAAIGVGSHDRI